MPRKKKTTRKTTKRTTKKFDYSKSSLIPMQCKTPGCFNEEMVDTGCVAVICWKCTQGMVPPPVIKSQLPKKTSGRPQGWHFMKEFVDKDGNVFHRGVEQPELKGTLPPTKVESKPRKKRRTKEQILVDRHKKKQAALRKEKGVKLGRPKKRGRPKGSKNKVK